LCGASVRESRYRASFHPELHFNDPVLERVICVHAAEASAKPMRVLPAVPLLTSGEQITPSGLVSRRPRRFSGILSEDVGVFGDRVPSLW